MWELFTYGGGDFLRMVFNGVATIFGDDNYYGALKSAALLGFIGVLIYAAFQKGPLDVKWILGIVMIVMVLVVPKVNVTITDRVVPANSAVVSNVPLGLGFTATAFSKLGDWLTRSFETVFSLPDQVSYSNSGLLFASHLVEASTRFEIITPRIANNFSDFWSSCVYYDLLLELYPWDDLATSTDIMAFLSTRTSKIRSFTYQPASGDAVIINCRDGLNNQLTRDLEIEVENSTHIRGVRSGSNESQTAAVSRFAAAMPVSYEYLTGISMTNAKILSQNVLANSFKRGLSSFAGQVDAVAASQDFAMARAEQERRNTFAVMGKLAKRMLPIMHSLFEAFIYAIFPIVMLLAMLPVAGKVLMGYVKALFWINMWPPLYAVLHFAMMYFGQVGAKASVVQTGSGFPSGLSMMTHSGLGEVLSDYAAIAGYLSLSIPMIAYMLVSQSGAIMAGLAGRMLQSYDNPVSRASDEVTSGNIQMGNVKYMTENAFQANAAPSDQRGGITVGDGVGNQTRITDSGGGAGYRDTTHSQNAMEINFGSRLVSSSEQSLKEAKSQAENTEVGLAETNAALSNQIASSMNHLSQSETGSTGASSTAQQAYSEAQQNTDRVLERLSEQHGVDIGTVKSVGGSLGFSVFGGTGAKTSYSAEQKNSESYQKAMEVLTSDEFTQALRSEGLAAQNVLRQSQVSDQDSLDTGLSASLSEQTQASGSHSVALNEVLGAENALRTAEQFSSQINQRANDDFMNWLKDEQGLSDLQVQQMMIQANQGGEAQRHLYNYAQEYMENGALASLVNTDVSLDKLEDGKSPGMGQVFNDIESRANIGMQDVSNTGVGMVSAQNASDQENVYEDADNIGGTVAKELNATAEQTKAAQDNPEGILSPENRIEGEGFEEVRDGAEAIVNKELSIPATERFADATEQLAQALTRDK